MKKRKVIYNIYLLVCRIIFPFLSFILPVNKKKVLFISFSGKRFDDSPRVIYEKMISNTFFEDWEFIWVFLDPSKYEILKGKKIKYNSFSFFIHAMTSKIWITNVSVERGAPLKSKKTIYVNTWHGTPLKRLGNTKVPRLYKKSTIDVLTTQSSYDANILKEVLNVPKEKIYICDLPRNDELVNFDFDYNLLKKKLGIPKNKKVLLYMPTYREFVVDNNNQYNSDLHIDFDKYDKELGDDYILLLRLHYLVSDNLNIRNKNVVDVSNYPKLNDLYKIADGLITDYSSAIFDYAILEKPIFLYCYDKEEYLAKRGTYLNLSSLPFEIAETEDELYRNIKIKDFNIKDKNVSEFKKIYANCAGYASEFIINLLIERIQGE